MCSENQNVEKRKAVCSSSVSKGDNLTIQQYEIDKRKSQIKGSKMDTELEELLRNAEKANSQNILNKIMKRTLLLPVKIIEPFFPRKKEKEQ